MIDVKPPNVKPIVMLYSGGADSMLMLRFAQMSGRQPHCVLIDYGQKHFEELDYAERQLSHDGLTYQIISIEDLNVDSGLTGELTEARWDNVHEMNVPARNTIFLGLAMSVAENMGIDEVWYGPDYSDRINLFPDCYQEYVVKMNEVSKISGVKPIKIVAPLLGMTKEIILEMLDTFWGIKETDMHSGYDDPAGKCRRSGGECECHIDGPTKGSLLSTKETWDLPQEDCGCTECVVNKLEKDAIKNNEL